MKNIQSLKSHHRSAGQKSHDCASGHMTSLQVTWLHGVGGGAGGAAGGGVVGGGGGGGTCGGGRGITRGPVTV